MIVRTNSGIAGGYGGHYLGSGTLLIRGTIESCDEILIKISNVKISGFSLGVFITKGFVINTPSEEKVSLVYVNKSSIVAIVINE